MGIIEELHNKAMECARNFRKAEAELLEIIQQIDDRKAFRDLGYGSLFSYAVEALKLTESQAYSFINVARKSKEVPELKEAVVSGKLSVGKARRIVPVLKADNQKDWIQKAIQLPQREVERQVAGTRPELAVRERIRPITPKRSELKCGISTELESKLKRIQDLLAQKGTAHTIESALEAMADLYLAKTDPMEKARRSQRKKTNPPVSSPTPTPRRRELCARQVRSPVPAAAIHQVALRDERRCRFEEPSGKRCESRRWLEVHHIVPVSRGGSHNVENLVTLCANHHRGLHRKDQKPPIRTLR